MLKIEETGFNALVNKIIRDKITKEESKSFKEDINILVEPIPEQDTNADLLFNKDDLHEQAIARSLIEFGLKEWDEEHTVAQYVFGVMDELDLHELIDNKMITGIISLYRTWYEEGLAPTAKSFLYHDDSEISQYIIKIMETNTEISINWKDKFEVKTPTREELYKEEVTSTFNYLKLRKIKRLISENQTALEKATDSNQQLLLMQTHQYLKKMEAEIMASNGTVIYK
jgi:DNA primase